VAIRVSRRPVSAHPLRFLVSFVLGATIALGVAAAIPAASFNDSAPCPHPGSSDPALVCPSGEVGKPYSLQLTGVGGCDLYWWENPQGALPPGLTLTPSGLISGTPTTAGTARFWIIIHDLLPSQGGHAWCGGDNKSEREHIIQIQPGFVVTTTSAPGAFTGTSYSFALAAAMQTTPETTTPPTSSVTWALAEGQLPPGLGLDGATGVIAGSPTTDGNYSFVVRASLPDGRSATKALSIEVKTALALVQPEEIPASEVGVPVRVQFGATGGTPPYTWTLSAGTLPAGVALTAAGTIAGRPTAAGTFPFTATVADSGGQSQSYAGTLVVAARLAIATTRLAPGRVGKRYRAKLLATGGVAPTLWIVTRGPLPRGVKLDRRLGVLSGVPKKAGRYKIRLQVRDTLGVRSTKTYLVIVQAAPKPRKPKR
jgi:large repetitive protein